jgi:hypothetical protein
MARIDIGAPYQKYLENLVDAGFYRSVTAAAEATILKQMQEDEQLRLNSIELALAKGEADIRSGKTVTYKPGIMKEITEKGRERVRAGKAAKEDVRP